MQKPLKNHYPNYLSELTADLCIGVFLILPKEKDDTLIITVKNGAGLYYEHRKGV